MVTSADDDVSDGPTPFIKVPLLRMQPSPTQDRSSQLPSNLIQRCEFENLYSTYQALHIRGFDPQPSSSQSKCSTKRFQAGDVQTLFESLNDHDKSSWCIENKANHSQCSGDEKAQMTPSEFLDISNSNQRGYCSFLVQESKTIMKDLLSDRLPMVHLPVANGNETLGEGDTMKVHYGPCLWLFFGKNPSGETTTTTLQGRPEHTDSITHDGTWHYQLSGTKNWRLRPTTELMKRIKECKGQKIQERQLSGSKRKFHCADSKCSDEEDGGNGSCDDAKKNYIEVECKEGDILLINTRLWWHSTLIPPQNVPCISYARDIYFPNAAKALSAETPVSWDLGMKDENTEEKSEKNNQVDQQQSSMTNVDGTYAAEDVEADTVLFTEHTMPNCELHRSKIDPNCQVVELEDEKTGESYMAVVTLRDIKAGEFFSILESDEEDEAEEDASDECVEEWEDEEEES